MARNKTLTKAKNSKKDEFYTQLADIESELRHYRPHFKDKIVLCNCDDPYESNFFKYFAMNFNQLRLKKLIATCYDGSPVVGRELKLDFGDDFPVEPCTPSLPKRTAYKIEITEVKDENGDGAVDLADVEYLIKNDKNVLSKLKGNGDFRSEECVELLKEADVVVTNPPFSLLNEYVLFLIRHSKNFLIMCNHNIVHYTEIFPLIKDNKVWLGYNSNKTIRFAIPDYYEKWDEIIDGVKYGKVPSIGWLTNLDINKRHEDIVLYKNFDVYYYPKYSNFDAIDIDSIAEIPCDYYGIMGVPDTFLDKFNPEQFEILGADGIPIYAEQLGIKRIGEEWLSQYRKCGGTGHYTANMKSLVMIKGGIPKKPFSRILIRRKQKQYAEGEAQGKIAADNRLQNLK